MPDGHKLVADFATSEVDHHSALCREYLESNEFNYYCLEDVLAMYQAPHDCVMFDGEWLCQDDMVHAWKEGCIELKGASHCGPDMVEIALQGCIELDNELVCPTAVGTKRKGYSNR